MTQKPKPPRPPKPPAPPPTEPLRPAAIARTGQGMPLGRRAIEIAIDGKPRSYRDRDQSPVVGIRPRRQPPTTPATWRGGVSAPHYVVGLRISASAPPHVL